MPNTPHMNIPYPDPSDPVANGAADMEAAATTIDDANGPWTAYVPSISSGGTNGNAARTGGYQKVGKTVRFWARIVLGSTSTITAGPIVISLPANATATQAYASMSAHLVDTGTADYDAIGILASVATASVWLRAASGAFTATGAAAPFTWTTGDIIEIRGEYEAA